MSRWTSSPATLSLICFICSPPEVRRPPDEGPGEAETGVRARSDIRWSPKVPAPDSLTRVHVLQLGFGDHYRGHRHHFTFRGWRPGHGDSFPKSPFSSIRSALDVSQPCATIRGMTSPWCLFETAAEGGFGRRARRATQVAVALILVLGLVWRAPEIWLIHSLATWKTHEVQHALQGVLHQLAHAKFQTPKPSGP